MIEISHMLLIASTECAQYIFCRRILPSAVGALVNSCVGYSHRTINVYWTCRYLSLPCRYLPLPGVTFLLAVPTPFSTQIWKCSYPSLRRECLTSVYRKLPQSSATSHRCGCVCYGFKFDRNIRDGSGFILLALAPPEVLFASVPRCLNRHCDRHAAPNRMQWHRWPRTLIKWVPWLSYISCLIY